MIDISASTSFKYDDGNGNAFSVIFLDESFVLVGTPGNQFFNMPKEISSAIGTSGACPSLKELFPNREAIKAAAQLFTEPLTDKEQFVDGVKKLQDSGKLESWDTLKLIDFIMGCDCPPTTVRQKLSNMGYGAFIRHLSFEKEQPELTKTVDAFELFVKEISR